MDDNKAFSDLKAAWPLDWKQRRRDPVLLAQYRKGGLVVRVSRVGRVWPSHVVVNRRRVSPTFDARSPVGIRTKVCKWAAALAPLMQEVTGREPR